MTPRAEAILARTDAFAAAHLDAEYAALCRRMAAALAELRPSPIERGEPRTWAAAVVHAVGWVNFLADPSQTPHLTTAELARLPCVGQSTLAAYLRTIRLALDHHRLDPAWSAVRLDDAIRGERRPDGARARDAGTAAARRVRAGGGADDAA